MRNRNDGIDLYAFNPQDHDIDEILAFLRELDSDQLHHRIDSVGSHIQTSLGRIGLISPAKTIASTPRYSQGDYEKIKLQLWDEVVKKLESNTGASWMSQQVDLSFLMYSLDKKYVGLKAMGIKRRIWKLMAPHLTECFDTLIIKAMESFDFLSASEIKNCTDALRGEHDRGDISRHIHIITEFLAKYFTASSDKQARQYVKDFCETWKLKVCQNEVIL